MKPLNGIQWLTIALVLALAVLVPINFVQLNHSIRGESLASKQAIAAGKRATQALCLLRKNYTNQAHSTAKYLKQHPDGAPALGLSAAYLQRAEKKQLSYAKALSGVKPCP